MSYLLLNTRRQWKVHGLMVIWWTAWGRNLISVLPELSLSRLSSVWPDTGRQHEWTLKITIFVIDNCICKWKSILIRPSLGNGTPQVIKHAFAKWVYRYLISCKFPLHVNPVFRAFHWGWRVNIDKSVFASGQEFKSAQAYSMSFTHKHIVSAALHQLQVAFNDSMHLNMYKNWPVVSSPITIIRLLQNWSLDDHHVILQSKSLRP
jgi:hypothetical protein